MKNVERQLVMGIASILLVHVFFLSRAEWDPMHAWNRAFADVSLTLLVVTIMIGPFGRMFPRMNRFLPWRRELGIWSAIAAFMHVYIIFDGWFQRDVVRSIAGAGPSGQLFFDPGFTLANLIGLIALVYLFLLALISNKKAITFLGKPAWSHLQQKSNVIYMLIVIHTAFFLFFYRPENPNILQKPFLIVIVSVFIIQWTVFFLTVRKNRLRSMNTLGSIKDSLNENSDAYREHSPPSNS